MWLEIQQQDSQEYLTFLLSQLDDEYDSNYKNIKIDYIPGINNYTENEKIQVDDIYKLIGKMNKQYSLIKELFFGTISSNVKCEFCSTNSVNFENFSTLTIDLPQDDDYIYELSDCLKNTFSEEQLDNNNKSYCEFCGIKNKGYKKNSIWKQPHILIIHLKRFKFQLKGTKNTCVINYPLTDLDISEFMDTNSSDNSKYDLFAVNIHEEFMHQSINAGHYTSIVLNRCDNNFYLFNDSHDVIKLEKEDAQNDNAYMLFYVKK